MAAEKLKDKVTTGIISSLFALVIWFLLFVVSNLGARLLNAADKNYVDEQDTEIRNDMMTGDNALQNNINENKEDHKLEHEKSDVNINRQFEDLKRDQDKNRDMIIDVIKENK